MLFIGPNDLASSMGYVAFDHASIPEVQEATKKVLKAALDAGKYAGHFALSAEAGTSDYVRIFVCNVINILQQRQRSTMTVFISSIVAQTLLRSRPG
jgi:2-keto-3-deoxy-L-rhamnonate aldolase RhmA